MSLLSSVANSASQSTVDTKLGYLPLEIVNNTNLNNVHIYIFIKALTLNKAPCIMTFTADGIGTCNDTNISSIIANTERVSLDKLPKNSQGNTVVYLPKVISGRIYFSIGQPMDLYYNPTSISIEGADGFKPRDVNYYTLYDMVEFSYDNSGTWVNPTAVDFFSIPISIHQGTSPAIQDAGSNQSRVTIFNSVQGVFKTYDKTSSKEWNKLLLHYADRSNNQTILRLVSPGKGLAVGVPNTTPFDIHYLDPYIQALS